MWGSLFFLFIFHMAGWVESLNFEVHVIDGSWVRLPFANMRWVNEFRVVIFFQFVWLPRIVGERKYVR